MNDAGIRGARGGLWSRQTVIQMLKNRTYIGKPREGDAEFLYPDICWIDEERFERVQQFFELSAKQHTGRPTKNRYLLTNYLRCSKCGRRCVSNPGWRQPSGRPCPYYRCGNIEYKPYRRQCDAPQIAKIEPVVWSAIWGLLTDAELLLANGQAYYGALPKSGTANLESELSEVKRNMENTQYMVRHGVMGRQGGLALIRADQHRIDEITRELRAAGRVLPLPSLQAAQAGLREIAGGPEPTSYEDRREVLNNLSELRILYYDGEVEVEGKVPIAAPAESKRSGQKKCRRGLGSYAEGKRKRRHSSEARGTMHHAECVA